MGTNQRLLAAALSGLGFFVTAQNALACDWDAYCCGPTCARRDPQYGNCTYGARSYGRKEIMSYTTPGKIIGWIELMYSPKCNANWSQITAAKGLAGPTGDAWLLDSSWVGVYGFDYCAFTSGCNYTIRSSMADGSAKLSACGSIVTTDGDGDVQCTDFF